MCSSQPQHRYRKRNSGTQQSLRPSFRGLPRTQELCSARIASSLSVAHRSWEARTHPPDVSLTSATHVAPSPRHPLAVVFHTPPGHLEHRHEAKDEETRHDDHLGRSKVPSEDDHRGAVPSLRKRRREREVMKNMAQMTKGLLAWLLRSTAWFSIYSLTIFPRTPCQSGSSLNRHSPFVPSTSAPSGQQDLSDEARRRRRRSTRHSRGLLRSAP